MSKNNNTLDGIEERVIDLAQYPDTVCEVCGELFRRSASGGAIMMTTSCRDNQPHKWHSETATLTTQLNEMREALRAIKAKALCFPDSYNKAQIKLVALEYKSTVRKIAVEALDKSGED